MNILDRVNDNYLFAQNIRRDIHQHPELGFLEFRTAKLIKEYLESFRIKVIDQIGKTGVVGILDSGKPGRTIMVRFDMDALPIQEENEVDYCSKVPRVMHACGHDGHVAIGLTTAKIISENIDLVSGKIAFLFQPAEEGMGGAKSMISDGVLDLIKPDIALAVHLWNEKPLGWLGISSSSLMAGADIIEITVKGKGGHGAMPQEALDPVIAAAQVLISMQTINSKFISPFEPAVISITEIKAGDAHNVIPSEAMLRGSLRTFNQTTRETIINRIQSIADLISNGYGCTAELTITPITPPVINSREISNFVIEAAKENLPDMCIDEAYKVMASEDMAVFLDKIPGCYMLIGSADEEKHLTAHHHNPMFDFSEEAMSAAIKLLLGTILSISR